MKRPNILLILADDMGYSDIGCFGAEIHTPNLDRLAMQGVRGTQMYNNARCCPSRACLLTGLHPHQTGVGHMVENKIPFDEYQGYLNDRCVTIAEALQAGEYRTGMCGKWHVGGNYWGRDKTQVIGKKGYPTPMQRGFEHFYGILEGAGDYYNPITLIEDGKWITPKPEDDFYFTEQISSKACGMIRDFARGQEPFFLYLSYTAPHWPLHAREEYIAKYKGKYLCGWQEIRKRRYARQIELGIVQPGWDLSVPDEDVPDWNDAEDKEFEARKMAVYAAQVEQMDAGIGQVLHELERTGKLDNTLILFMSDNGGCAEVLPADGWILGCANTHTLTGKPVEIGNNSRRWPGGPDTYMSYGHAWANASNTPFRLYKHWIHEGGISTPFIINWNAQVKEKGKIVHTPMHFTDVLPTLLQAAGVSYPLFYKQRQIQPVEGESFLPILTGEWKRQNPIFWEHEGNCGMRTERYKLVRKYPLDYELYDMYTDRTEQENIAAQNPLLLQQMIAEYEKWALRIGVKPWPEVVCYYK